MPAQPDLHALGLEDDEEDPKKCASTDTLQEHCSNMQRESSLADLVASSKPQQQPIIALDSSDDEVCSPRAKRSHPEEPANAVREPSKTRSAEVQGAESERKGMPPQPETGDHKVVLEEKAGLTPVQQTLQAQAAPRAADDAVEGLDKQDPAEVQELDSAREGIAQPHEAGEQKEAPEEMPGSIPVQHTAQAGATVVGPDDAAEDQSRPDTGRESKSKAAPCEAGEQDGAPAETPGPTPVQHTPQAQVPSRTGLLDREAKPASLRFPIPSSHQDWSDGWCDDQKDNLKDVAAALIEGIKGISSLSPLPDKPLVHLTKPEVRRSQTNETSTSKTGVLKPSNNSYADHTPTRYRLAYFCLRWLLVLSVIQGP